jgi:hypothetical protein
LKDKNLDKKVVIFGKEIGNLLGRNKSFVEKKRVSLGKDRSFVKR